MRIEQHDDVEHDGKSCDFEFIEEYTQDADFFLAIGPFARYFNRSAQLSKIRQFISEAESEAIGDERNPVRRVRWGGARFGGG